MKEGYRQWVHSSSTFRTMRQHLRLTINIFSDRTYLWPLYCTKGRVAVKFIFPLVPPGQMPGPVRYFRVVVRLWLKLLYHVFPCTSKRAHSFLLSSNECSRILTYHSNVGYRYVRCYEPQSRSPQGKDHTALRHVYTLPGETHAVARYGLLIPSIAAARNLQTPSSS